MCIMLPGNSSAKYFLIIWYKLTRYMVLYYTRLIMIKKLIFSIYISCGYVFINIQWYAFLYKDIRLITSVKKFSKWNVTGRNEMFFLPFWFDPCCFLYIVGCRRIFFSLLGCARVENRSTVSSRVLLSYVLSPLHLMVRS